MRDSVVGSGSAMNALIANGGSTIHSPVYHLLATDLRRPPEETLEPLLASTSQPVLSPALPTLLLFECVLVYMTPASSNGILRWFTGYFSSPSAKESRSVLGCIVYEMFALEDAFGKVMVNNLRVSLQFCGRISTTSNGHVGLFDIGPKCISTWRRTLSDLPIPSQPFLDAWLVSYSRLDPQRYSPVIYFAFRARKVPIMLLYGQLVMTATTGYPSLKCWTRSRSSNLCLPITR